VDCLLSELLGEFDHHDKVLGCFVVEVAAM
jgi:hypothetical protein